MEQILAHVDFENVEWVKSLGVKGIANILNGISSIVTIPENTAIASANIGKVGEFKFEEMAETLGNAYEILNNAKKAHSGDFHIKWTSTKTNRQYTLLVDVKNYKSSVPSKEIEKLRRDMNENIADAGMMVSLKSKITGYRKTIVAEKFVLETGKQIPFILANASTPIVICEIIKMAFHMAEAKDLFINDGTSLDDLFRQINQLPDCIQTMVDARTIMQESRQQINSSLDKIMYRLMACEFSLASQIRAINKCIVRHQQDICIDEPVPNKALNMIDHAKAMFILSPESIPLFQAIFDLNWDSSQINVSKKQWSLEKKSCDAIIKMTKSPSIILPIITMKMQPALDRIGKNKKNIRKSRDGMVIKLTAETITDILEVLI